MTKKMAKKMAEKTMKMKKPMKSKQAAPASSRKKTPKKTSRFLLADDIAAGEQNDQRSRAVRAVAGRLAGLLGAGIDVLHVEDTTYYPVRDPSLARLFERFAREQKAKLEDQGMIPDSVPVRSLLATGSPAAKILEAAGKKKDAYELLVIGTQGRRGLGRLLVGSVAEEVVRNARIPVMTIGPEVQNSSSVLVGGAVRILVPTGLTKNSARAEDYAASLARRLGAELVLFHGLYDGLHPVIQGLYGYQGAPADVQAMMDKLRSDAHAALEKKAKAFRAQGLRASAELDGGNRSATDAVLAAAKAHGASLIVMGTHGRGLMGGAFLGTTARGVILGAGVPVITVRSRSA